MLKKSTITFSLALSFMAIVFIGGLNSCKGSSSGSEQSSDSTQTGTETSTSIGGNKKYEIKSGIVYYKPIEIMKGIKTQEVMYFDDYGNKEAKESVTESNFMGITSKEKKMSIMDGDYSITYTLEKIENGKDVTEKVAQKMKLTNDMKAMGNMAAMFADTEKLKNDFDYKEEGTETVAGVSGKKFSMRMDKSKNERINVVTYKNILLKTEMMKIKIEAEKIEENVSVPTDKFSIPSGYKVEEVSMDQLNPQK